ncbi:GIY-YIG nuclease family protein [Sphingomonas sp. 1P06PA]|uniref:GIY-YIG nuclease family protein n=1 Tax=Sphingomonas sp. 1P06PA TaxID=554121 RepID=UPI0039A6CA88
MQGGWVYIMTNGPSGTLYTGVTSNLRARVYQHRIGVGSEFCARWGLIRLVHAELFPTVLEAIAREKALKRWKRGWKLDLIAKSNPEWRDLFDTINA